MTDKQPIYAELPTCHIDGYVREWRSGICTADEAMRGIAALAAQAPRPATATPAPPECVTDAEKKAYAFGWWKSLESNRMQAPQQAAPAAEWLEQAYREGWAACRDAETIGQEAEDWAFGNSTANSRMIDMQQAAPQQEVQEPVPSAADKCGRCVGTGRIDTCKGAPGHEVYADCPDCRHSPTPQQEVQEPVTLYPGCSRWGFKGDTAQPAPSVDAWKDGGTAALVNQLRDVAVQYRDTQQLRERIAQVVRPLAERVAPSGDAEDAARYRWLRDENEWYFEPRLDAEDGTVWRLTFYTPAQVVDVTDDDSLNASIDAARKEGNTT